MKSEWQHVVGVPTILVTQDLDDIPFDIRHRRVITYDITNFDKFRLDLEIAIHAELTPRISPGKRTSFRSPKMP